MDPVDLYLWVLQDGGAEGRAKKKPDGGGGTFPPPVHLDACAVKLIFLCACPLSSPTQLDKWGASAAG